MVGQLVDLDFACCGCDGPVGVTVRCEGKGLTDRRRVAAAFNVRCPHCRDFNRISFEPDGTVLNVVPTVAAHQILELSVN